MESKALRGEKADELIVRLLREAGHPLTTREVQTETEKLLVRCPDTTAVFLNKLRIRGAIHGELDREKRAWVWWV
jgi:hypothetical protein